MIVNCCCICPKLFHMHPYVILAVWKYCASMCISCEMYCHTGFDCFFSVYVQTFPCAFYVECSATLDLTVDILLFMFKLFTCIYMLFLLCGNNVQVCAFHVECSATRELTVDFLVLMFKLFHMHPHVIRAV